MTKLLRYHRLYLLLAAVFFFTSCHGQAPTGLPTGRVGATTTSAGEQPRLLRTQGTNPAASVDCGVPDKAGNIWFTTWFEGIYRFDGHSLTNFRPNGEVWFDALFEDKAGTIWVGRRDQGVCRYDGSTFTNLVSKGILDNCGVTSIAEDAAGNLWFGTEAGKLTMRETTGGVWRYTPAPAAGAKAFTNFTTADGLSNNCVFSIVQEQNGTLWFGTRNVGLCRYDGKTITRFSGNEQPVWEKYGN